MKKATHARHGLTHLREYGIWGGMRTRCNNRNNPKWIYYGGRGITVCDRWDSFPAFMADMGNSPTPLHWIDRINPDGNYEPSNCRWSTRKEQQQNQRPHKDSRYIKFNGEKLSIKGWAKRLGMNDFTIYNRLRSGWSVKDTLTRPSHCGVSPGGWRRM